MSNKQTLVESKTNRFASTSIVWVSAVVFVTVVIASVILGLQVADEYGGSTTAGVLQDGDRYKLSGYRSLYFPDSLSQAFDLEMTTSTGTKEVISVSPGASFRFKHLFLESETYTLKVVDITIRPLVHINAPTGVFEKGNICTVSIEYHHAVSEATTLISSDLTVNQSDPHMGTIKCKITFGNIRPEFQLYVSVTDSPLPTNYDWSQIVENSSLCRFTNPLYGVDPHYSQDVTVASMPNRYTHFAWLNGEGVQKTILNLNLTETEHVPTTPVLSSITPAENWEDCARLIAHIDTKITDPGMFGNYEVCIYDEEIPETPIWIEPILVAGEQDYTFVPFADLAGITRNYHVRINDRINQVDSRKSNTITHSPS